MADGRSAMPGASARSGAHRASSSCWMTVIAMVILAATGCGGPPRATVRGTVTLDGKPLPGGTVVFEADGRSFTGAIGGDGRYELRHLGKPEVSPGTYGVAVLPPEPKVVADPKTTQLKAVSKVDLRLYPEAFRLPAASGIAKTVPEGESTIDIELSSR